MSVMSIQERLEQKARQSAMVNAQNDAAKLPQFKGNVAIPKGMLIGAYKDEDVVMVNFSDLKMVLRAFFEQQYTEVYLDQYSQELMAKLGG